jgi:2-methylcitrate dehydratase PrpD
VARALVTGSVVFEHFEGDALRDAEVRALLLKVQSMPARTGQLPADNSAGAEIRITLADGRVLTSNMPRALGRTALNPVPESGLREKFRSCARRVLADEAVEPLLRAMDDFEHATDVASFMNLTATPS